LIDSMLGICHLEPVDQEGEMLALQGLHVLDYGNADCREDQQRLHLRYQPV